MVLILVCIRILRLMMLLRFMRRGRRFVCSFGAVAVGAAYVGCTDFWMKWVMYAVGEELDTAVEVCVKCPVDCTKATAVEMSETWAKDLWSGPTIAIDVWAMVDSCEVMAPHIASGDDEEWELMV